MNDKTRAAIQQAFETWWEREGQEFLYALNTTTDDDIKLVAEIAWKNGAYKAEQPMNQEPVRDSFIRERQQLEQEWCELRKLQQAYAAPQPVSQEPVAEYLGYTAKSGDVFRLDKEIPVGTKLYTAPQPVKEVELTDDEILPDGYSVVSSYEGLLSFARAVIAAHKEKNK